MDIAHISLSIIEITMMATISILIPSFLVNQWVSLTLNVMLWLRLLGFSGEFRCLFRVLSEESVDVLGHVLPIGLSDPFQVFHYGLLQVKVSLGLAHAGDEGDREAHLSECLHFAL